MFKKLWNYFFGPHIPKFKVGDCIAVDISYELWQIPTISRVFEVGKKAYRCRYFNDQALNWYSIDNTVFFSMENIYKKVEDPTVMKVDTKENWD